MTLLVVTCLPLIAALSGCSASGGRHRESRAACLRKRILLPEMRRIEEGGEGGAFRREVARGRPITLAEAIAIALANNPSLKISAEEVIIARGNTGVARSLFFPQVSGGYGLVRNEMQPAFVNPDDPLTPPFYAGEREFQRAELRVQMLLWDFGKTLGTYRQAVLAGEIAELSARRNVQLVRLQVREAYFDILRERKAQSIAEESLAQAQAHLKTAGNFLRQGMVDKNDVLRAELQVAEVKQALIKAKNAVESATSAFNSILGINVNHETQVADVQEVPRAKMSLREALQVAVDNRPEFEVVQKNIRIQEEAMTIARAEYMPRIYVGGGYNWTDDAYRKWGKGNGDPHQGAWVGEVGIGIDLFSGGRRPAKTQIARSEIRRAEQQARQLCDAIALQVKSGVLGIAEAGERVAVAEKAVAQAGENLRLVNGKYREGTVSSTDVVDAETALSRAQSNYYNGVYDCHTATARLTSAVGKDITGQQQRDSLEEEEKPEGLKE